MNALPLFLALVLSYAGEIGFDRSGSKLCLYRHPETQEVIRLLWRNGVQCPRAVEFNAPEPTQPASPTPHETNVQARSA